jgi:hypothetical protein
MRTKPFLGCHEFFTAGCFADGRNTKDSGCRTFAVRFKWHEIPQSHLAAVAKSAPTRRVRTLKAVLDAVNR